MVEAKVNPSPSTAAHNGQDTPALDLDATVGLVEVSPRDSATLALRAALSRSVRQLLANEPKSLRGEVEGVHQLRTAARRLRSDLRTFGKLVDDSWARNLSEELRWLGGGLGAVRDLDVLRLRLRATANDLEPALTLLDQSLTGEHERASQALRRALRSERFHDLRERLIDAAAHPVLTEAADQPCQKALPRLVAAAWRKLAKSARALDPSAPDEHYHAVRIRAKRARYAAEAVAPALNSTTAKAATRFARRAAAVQNVLGEHQDALVACEVIRRVAADHPQNCTFQFALGQLFERQRQAALLAREQFPQVWDELDRKVVTRWLER